MLGGVVQSLEDDDRRCFPRRCAAGAERADRQKPGLRRASHQPGMRHDRAGNAGAVDMRTFLAAERIEIVRDRIGKFGMRGVDAGIDHRNGDVHAAGQRMRLRQPKLRDRILRGIALGQRRLSGLAAHSGN